MRSEMPRRRAGKGGKKVFRKYVPLSAYSTASPRLPDPSDWILLSRQYGDHSFTKKDSKVPLKPGCYEIGVSPPEEKPKTWVVYVGKTGKNKRTLRDRFYNHASGHGSNIKGYVDRYLNRGYWVWARHYATNSLEEADALEKLLIKANWGHYLWNTQEVPPDLPV